MVVASSNKARGLKSAAPGIHRFLAHIRNANSGHLTALQMGLINALKKVTVFLNCYYNKLRMVTYVEDYCHKGHADIQTLFNQANRAFNSNSQFCRTKNGFAYTTLDSVKRLIRARSKKKWFNFDCILNNVYKRKRTCRMKWDGYSVSEIVKKLGIKTRHVNHFLMSCGQRPITPKMKRQVCYLRKDCTGEKFISSLMSIAQKRLIKDVECPCHEFSSK